ncbi:MAG: BLUF domain-containing protein [Planctomycetota bacterium]
MANADALGVFMPDAITMQKGVSMLSVIYTSKATSKVTPEMVDLLSTTSARNNKLAGVTGLLLYGSGNYLQIMEGEADRVGPLFERVKKDCRHTDCQVLLRQPTGKRCFKGWRMGLLGDLDADPAEQTNEWDTITTMLRVMPGTGVIKTQDDMLECVRDFICCNTALDVLN